MDGMTRRKFVGVVGAGIAGGLALAGTASAEGLGQREFTRNRLVPLLPSSATPQTWYVTLGGQSAGGEIELLGFFPGLLWINVGDSITFTGNSVEPHTVTFFAPRQQRPAFNPTDPNQTQTVPPTPADGVNRYDGHSYTNSGLVGKGQSYTLQFDEAGSFTSYCLMHSMMKCVIHVRPAGTPYPYGQGYYDRIARSQMQAQVQYGEQVRMVSLAESSADGRRGYQVSIGGGNGPVALMRFYPATLVVPAGSSVTFTNVDMEAPHTVTFGPEPDPANEPFPTGDPTGYSDLNQTLSSGFIGLDPNWFGNSFTVTFPHSGTYPYRCLLHDEMGMVGTIVVVDQ